MEHFRVNHILAKLFASLAVAVMIIDVLPAFTVSTKPYLAVDPTYWEVGYHPPEAIGQEFNERIYVRQLDASWNLENVTTYLAYNTTLLSVVNIVFNSLWNITDWSEPTNGDLSIQASNVSELPSGDVLIAKITFRIMFQDGSPPRPFFDFDACPLDLHDYTLVDSSGSLIPTDPEVDGQFRVYCFLGGVPFLHDLEVTGITLFKTVVQQNFKASFNVTVLDNGSYYEYFNITVYANTTVIGNATSEFLGQHNSMSLSFDWNTTGFDKGNYTITAFVPPLATENDTADNTLTDGWIIVSMIGDVTGANGWPDGKCNMEDIGNVARLFGKDYPDARYNPNYDINDDKKINMEDIGTVARHFGENEI